MTHFVNILLSFKLSPHQMLNANAPRLGGHTKTEQTGIEVNCLNVHYGVLVNKTNRCTEFQFYWYYDSTCFGPPLCPSSQVVTRSGMELQ
jgi:hypothetical protein